MFHEIGQGYPFIQKNFKKKKFSSKMKFNLTIVLPIFVFVLFLKAAKIFIEIKIRKLFSKPVSHRVSEKSGTPVPISVVPVHKEIQKPQRIYGKP